MSSSSHWYLYIAESKSGKYYVGITTDVENRINNHNLGRGSQLAKIDGPFTLRYVSENLGSQSRARKKEIQIKKWSRDKKEKLISEEWSLET